MKIGTLKNKSRDGELVLVSPDGKYTLSAKDIAPNLQYALDHWSESAPELEQMSLKLIGGKGIVPHPHAIPADWKKFHSPLPRAYQWVDGSAYVNHVELVRKARGAEMPANFWTDPLMYQGGSDSFLAPSAPIIGMQEAWGIDFESEIAVITDDVPMGVSADDALSHVKLVMLVNDVSLRNLIPNEIAKGFGFFQSKPSSAFSPLALTPNELGDLWQGGKLNLPLSTFLNDKLFGQPFCHVDMTFHFGQLIAHAALSRPLAAGTIVGSGTVSNLDRSRGSSCIAEKRMLETIESGKPVTPFLKDGDKVRIEIKNVSGESIFGAIEQIVSCKQ
jgi:fumarylacetoacetate (FAA) hydrolase